MEKCKVSVIQENKQQEYLIDKNTKLIDLAKEYDIDEKNRIMAAKVGNNLAELSQEVKEDCSIRFVKASSTDGNQIYKRGLIFILIRSAYEILGECQVKINYSINKGLFIEVKAVGSLTKANVTEISERMREIVERDEPFIRREILLDEAAEIFKKQKMFERVELLKYRKEDLIHIYSCGWMQDYLFGYMPASTGYLKNFELRYYNRGILLRFPTVESPLEIPPYANDQKIAYIFNEAKDWNGLIGVSTVVDLNRRIEAGSTANIIRVNEALHERKIGKIADMIFETGKRIILIAGPSSSGKTTFAQRLAVHLRVCGLDPVSFSTDDYFMNREDQVPDENGKYNFEDIEAVDVALFNRDLNSLLLGDETDLPEFDFLQGKKIFGNRKIKLEENQPIIIEGIHGLNNLLTKEIKDHEKFKIYISPLTALNIDDHNRLATTDARLLRRMVRDNRCRGYDGKKTLKVWADVRAGEEKNIFPFQEEADVMFNSTLVYETAVLKKYAQPLLATITEDDEEYSEAKRLLSLLSYFTSLEDESAILNNSILREFIGGGCFLE